MTFIVFLVLHINEILSGVCSKNEHGRHGMRSQCILRRKRERRKPITLPVPRESTLQSRVRKPSCAGQETDRSRQERGAPGKEKTCQRHRLVSLLWIISSGFGTLEVLVRCLGSGSGKTGQGEHFGLVWEGLIKGVVGDRYLGLVGLQRKVFFVRGQLGDLFRTE